MSTMKKVADSQKATKKSRKSRRLIVDVTPTSGQQSLLMDYVVALEKLGEAQEEVDHLYSKVYPLCVRHMVDQVKKLKAVPTSIRLALSQYATNNSVMFTSANKYGIKAGFVKLLTATQKSKFVTTGFSMSLKKTAQTRDNYDLLIKKLGKGKVEEMFNVAETNNVSDDFHDSRWKDSRLRDKVSNAAATNDLSVGDKISVQQESNGS